ncbi:MAG: hypothetical protein L0M01_11470, partial [Lacticaseibacillus paracasei]|nr:hypothetical protein [Lacticaseibacillus paracasei]
ETAGFAGSKRRHSVPAPAGRRLRSLARQGPSSPDFFPEYLKSNKAQFLDGNDGSTCYVPSTD